MPQPLARRQKAQARAATRLLLRAVLAAPRIAARQIAGLERPKLARQAAALARQRPAPPAPEQMARAARSALTARWETLRVAATWTAA
ncbi:MAG: hypothetical protein WA837_17525 [Xanthobacteraceae bacterium]